MVIGKITKCVLFTISLKIENGPVQKLIQKLSQRSASPFCDLIGEQAIDWCLSGQWQDFLVADRRW